jgi:crotonobetainyl-CoA:carnitine CoA-transferase CaiB-like acyl-CoA transferase
MAEAIRLPLAGYRVLELAHLVAGQVCGMYLADMGAEVINVESPDGGDASRSIYAATVGGDGMLFLMVNRNKRSNALVTELTLVFATRRVSEWMARLEAHDVLCAPVNRHADLLDDPQIAANSTFVEQIHPSAGPIWTMSTPVRLRRTPGGIRTPAPALGQDTAVVLAQLGVDAAALDRLGRVGVIACTA